MPVYVVLGDEEQEAEGGDQRAGEAVHHRHAEDQGQAGVLKTNEFPTYFFKKVLNLNI